MRHLPTHLPSLCLCSLSCESVSGHCCGDKSRLFFQGLCHFRSVIDFAQSVSPRSILGQVPVYVINQIAPAFAAMIASDFVVPIAEATLDGMGTRAVGG